MTDNETSEKKPIGRYPASPLTAFYNLIKDYFLAIAGAAVVALVLRVFVIEAFRIPTDFMAPALLPGDLIFVDKLAFFKMPWSAERKPARGDVVVFAFPNDPTKDYIKRVIGVEGDNVEVRANQIYINGRSISRQVEPETFEENLNGRHYYATWTGASVEARNMVAVVVPVVPTTVPVHFCRMPFGFEAVDVKLM